MSIEAFDTWQEALGGDGVPGRAFDGFHVDVWVRVEVRQGGSAREGGSSPGWGRFWVGRSVAAAWYRVLAVGQ